MRWVAIRGKILERRNSNITHKTKLENITRTQGPRDFRNSNFY